MANDEYTEAVRTARIEAGELRLAGLDDDALELDSFVDIVERFVRGEDVSGVTHPYFA